MNPRPDPPPANPQRGPRLLLLAAGFAVLLTFPLLSAADQPARLAGVPVVYVYVLVCWGLLIGGTAWLSRH